MNAYAERWVRSVKEECLSRLILFGERALWHALTQYEEHYHRERNHQGKGNVLLIPPVHLDRAPTSDGGPMIGLGFIGSEVTASLRQLGVEVTAVDGQRAPLARVLGEEVGAVLAEIHRDKGAELLLEDGVAAFEGVGRVERVRTRKGRFLAARFRGGWHRRHAQHRAAGRGGGGGEHEASGLTDHRKRL